MGNLYSIEPCPLYKIIDNILNFRYKILDPSPQLVKSTYNYIKELRNTEWTNTDNRSIKFTELDAETQSTLIKTKCNLCDESHSDDTIQLYCKHFFHLKCLNSCIDYYYDNNKCQTELFKCPYCTCVLNINELI